MRQMDTLRSIRTEESHKALGFIFEGRPVVGLVRLAYLPAILIPALLFGLFDFGKIVSEHTFPFFPLFFFGVFLMGLILTDVVNTTTRYSLTEEYIERRIVLFGYELSSTRLHLSAVRQVTITGNFLGYGSVKASSAGLSVCFALIHDPKDMQELIWNAVLRHR